MSPHHCRDHSHSHPMIEPTTEPIELSGAPVPVEEGENVEPLEHEALVGDEITSEKLVEKLPTIATLGDTPFEENGEEMEHHKIVATEIVADPLAAHEPEPIVSYLFFGSWRYRNLINLISVDMFVIFHAYHEYNAILCLIKKRKHSPPCFLFISATGFGILTC